MCSKYKTVTSVLDMKFFNAESAGILKSGSIENPRTIRIFASNSVACRVRLDCGILKIILHSMSSAGKNKSGFGVEDCSEIKGPAAGVSIRDLRLHWHCTVLVQRERTRK